VYLGLAVLIGGGLILFGVGTGTGGGGLLNGIANNGSGGNGAQAVSQQERTALKEVKADPNSAAAWSQLVQARYISAGQAGNFNSSTNTFTATGKRKLLETTQAWQRYQQLTKSPDPNVALYVAHAYTALGQYAGAASAWEVVTAANPSQDGYGCLAASAYAAGQTDKGDLALDKALTLTPKAQQSQLKSTVTAAKTQPSIVQQQCG
jgi:tetratricopeptide (TPR) repeat protein